MINLVSQINATLARPFARNVLTVAGGTAASQAIAMAFTPMITRLYGPETFGLQSIFMTVLGFAATLAALGYPGAIILPRKDEDAKSIVRLSLWIALLSSGLLALALYIWGTKILSWFNAEKIASFSFLLPIATIISILGTVLGQWLIRKKKFMLTAKYSVISAFLMSVSKAIAGVINPTAIMLISINIAGALFATLLTYIGLVKCTKTAHHDTKSEKYVKTPLQLGKEHWDFAILRTPQNLINGFSQGLPILMLAGYFGAKAAGQYGLALTLLGMPIGLIGGSVMSVFSPRINEAIHNRENCHDIIVRATKVMAITGALPFLVILVAGPSVFTILFGKAWTNAGVYAQLLAPWMFLQYINKPAIAAIPALRLQGGLLLYEVFSTATKVAALYLGFSVMRSDIAAIAMFSTAGVAAYIWLIIWVVRKSGKLIVAIKEYHEAG